MKNNIRKFIIASTALFISLNSFAQLGVTAGLTSSSAYVSESTVEVDTKAMVNFHAGICYKYALGEGDPIFVLQPSLIYTVKGSKLSESDKVEAACKTGYLELPVQIQVGIPFGNICRLYGVVEPFIGYALTNKVDGIELKDKWSNVPNRFEYGANIGAGLEILEHFQISVRYSLNLENALSFVLQQAIGNLSVKRKGVFFSVAYIF